MSSIISSISSHLASNIFSKLDTSNSGAISQADFTSAMSELAGDDSDVSSLVSSVDSDSDGQITESELTTGIENLLSQLTSSSSSASNRMPPPPPGGGMGGMQGMGGMGGGMQSMGGMPPPPPPSSEGEDEGVTADQASEIASSTGDEKLSEIMSEISENFDEIDTDSDGKVTRDEAMAYHESQKTDYSSSTESSSSSSSSASDALIKELMAKLVETYGLSDSSSESSSVTETA